VQQYAPLPWCNELYGFNTLEMKLLSFFVIEGTADWNNLLEEL
jgi:hypothetical protein